ELQRPSADDPPAAQPAASPPAARSAAPAPAPPRVLSALAAAAKFTHRLVEKAGEDRIFFMAGAIAFNVLVAFVPLLLTVVGIGGRAGALASNVQGPFGRHLRAGVGIGGRLLRRGRQAADSTQPLMQGILASVPALRPGLEELCRRTLRRVRRMSTGLLSVGT